MKKKLTLVVTCVVLVAAMVIGGTLAYFTDTETAKNTFTMGNVNIILNEAPVIKTDDRKWEADKDAKRVTSNDYGAIYPGAVLPKDPTVKNIGTEDAYIRATVTITKGFNILPELFPDIVKADRSNMDKAFLALVDELGEGWSIEAHGMVSQTNYQDYVFVLKYDRILKAGETAPAIFQQVTIPADYDNKNSDASIGDFEITVVAEAIQTAGFEDTMSEDGKTVVKSAMQKAWEAFDA